MKEHHIDTETYKKALSGSIAMTGTNVDFILKGINEYLMALAKEKIRIHRNTDIQNENAVFLFCGLCRMDNHTVQPNLYNGGRKISQIGEKRMRKFLMVLLSIAFVLNLAIVIGLIGGYGSPRRALYTITDELMNSAYRFKRGWQFKNSLP